MKKTLLQAQNLGIRASGNVSLDTFISYSNTIITLDCLKSIMNKYRLKC